MQLDNNNHSVFLMYYHLVLVVKYRRNVFEVRRKLWKEMFWSRSFCLLTTGGAPIEIIREYIESQGR